MLVVLRHDKGRRASGRRQEGVRVLLNEESDYESCRPKKEECFYNGKNGGRVGKRPKFTLGFFGRLNLSVYRLALRTTMWSRGFLNLNNYLRQG